MKRVLAFVLVLACTVLLGSSVFAATEFTAEVSFAGSGVVQFDALLKKVADNTAATNITWETEGIDIGSSSVQWKTSSVYAVMTSTITKTVGKVYMYQNNKGAGTAAYVAVDPRHEGLSGTDEIYSGLVKGGSNGGETGYLPMAFKISTVTVASPVVTPGTYGSRYFIDQDNSTFVKDGYCMVANSSGYVEDVATGNVPNNFADKTSVAYMYFTAGFKNIMGGDAYGSNHIKYELVTE